MAKSKKKPYEDKWQRLDDKPIGEGGHGRAYRVASINGSNSEAHILKELKDNKDPDRRLRFRAEVLALRKLTHPLIAKVVDDNMDSYEDIDVPLYFVSEFAGATSLTEMVTSNGPKGLELATNIVMSMLNTLAFCHSSNVIHRDIKPDNVILNSEFQPVLIDFGQCFDFEEGTLQATPDWQHMGNRFLILPELTMGDGHPDHKRDSRSDVTFCAGILFYLLTGLEPVSLVDPKDNSMPHQREKPRKILDETIFEPQRTRLNRIFDKAFQTMMDHRYQSCDELRLELERMLRPVSGSDSGGLTQALNTMRESGDYKLRETKLQILHRLADALNNAAGQVASFTLR